MLSATGSPLVGGSARTSAMSNTVTIKALRPFYIKGELLKAGKEAEVDRFLAAELVGANKAAVVTKPPPKPAPGQAAPPQAVGPGADSGRVNPGGGGGG